MPTRDRALDLGTIRATRLVATLGDEIRHARRAVGLSQASVGAAAGLSSSRISRIERGDVPTVSLRHLVRIASIVGLDLSARTYPVGTPIRDAAHASLLVRLRARLHPNLMWRTEVPIGTTGDLRAWDATIRGRDFVLAVEAETRPRDLQALERRINLKRRDSRVDSVLLLLTDSRANADLVRDFGDVLASNFPVSARRALLALADGEDPGGSSVIRL